MFQFKQFTICQDLCAMKVGTDGVLLGAWANGGKRILDAGTGTGIIALMMAQRYPNAVVTAIDIDEGAVKQAQQNVVQSPFSQQITVLHNTLQEHQGEYDAIISNPPFFIDSLAWRLLSDEGELSVVVPFDYRKRMEDEAIFVGFFPSKVCAVKTTERKPAKRYLLSFKKHPCRCEQEQLTIGSEMYQELTKEFYL